MNNFAQELSDDQLDTISGGCSRFERRERCRPSHGHCEEQYVVCETQPEYEEPCGKPPRNEHCGSTWQQYGYGHGRGCW